MQPSYRVVSCDNITKHTPQQPTGWLEAGSILAAPAHCVSADVGGPRYSQHHAVYVDGG
jgi:hypothetical protein